MGPTGLYIISVLIYITDEGATLPSPNENSIGKNSSLVSDAVSLNDTVLVLDQGEKNSTLLLLPVDKDLNTTSSTVEPSKIEGLYKNCNICKERLHLPQDCGAIKFNHSGMRIIDGDKANIGQFPWMVRLGKKQPSGKIKFDCGGSLINRYYVIAAAHCDPDNDIIRLGENHLHTDIDCNDIGECAPPHQDIELENVLDPGFCYKGMLQDYSLVELKTPAKFNDFVQPVCLPYSQIPYEKLEGGFVTTMGWGLIDPSPQKFTDFLMYVIVPFVKKDDCSKLYKTELLDSQLCIGYPQGKDSCGGDSGGPVVKTVKENGMRRSYLVGVVSYGLSECGKGPAVYSDVSYFLNWTLARITKS